MKKLLTILAAILLVLSFGINASAYSVDDGYLDRAVTLLTDLDIISDIGDYTDPVTRGAFTNMLVKALGIGDVATSNPIPFTDVARGDSYYDAVQTAYNLGIISRAELFNPSCIISYDEIVKMTVCAAGYTFLADHFGTYPAGHQAAANRLGMLKGITTADGTYATAYVLLYNTITTDLPQVAIVDGAPEYSIDSGTNILESAYGLSLIEGQVDGAEFFGGVSGDGVGEGYTSINGVLLKKGEFDTDSMYGSACSAWYDTTGTIRTIYAEAPAKNDVLVLKSSEDVSYSNMAYTYYTDDDTQRTVSVGYDCLVVLNGKKAVYSDDIMLPAHGTVKLVRTGKGGYDTVIIDSYNEIVVGGINAEKQFLADIADPSISVSLKGNDYSRISIYDQNGRSLTFDKINKNDVLWYAKSADGELIKVLVSKNKFTGEYLGITGESGINVDGNDYTFSQPVSQAMDSSVVMGSVVMLHLNIDGEVAYVASGTSASDVNVAYLVASKLTTGMDSNITVKLFTAEGEMKTYDCAPTLVVNGEGHKETADGYATLPKNPNNANSMLSGLVTYRVNAKGELARINYADDASVGTYADLYKNGQINSIYTYDDEGTQVSVGDNYIRYYREWRTIRSSGGSIFVHDNTIQFRVPRAEDASIATDDDYKIRKFSGIENGEYMTDQNHLSYSLTKDSMLAGYMLSTYSLGSSGSVKTSGDLYMITSISRGFSPEENECTVITLSGATVENLKLYLTDDTFVKNNNIGAGDIVKVEYDARKNIASMLLIYKPGDNKLTNISSKGSSGYGVKLDNTLLTTDTGNHAKSQILLGKTYQLNDAFAAFMPYKMDMPSDNNDTNLIRYDLKPLTKIIKFNIKAKTANVVDYTALNDYKSMGSMADTVVVEGDSGLIDALFIFE